MTPNFYLSQIVVAKREEAEEVIEVLRRLINTHKLVTINQFYELVNLREGDFLGDEWGWSDLRTASVRETQDGYRFDLPPIEHFK
jgi:hypothetical protein